MVLFYSLNCHEKPFDQRIIMRNSVKYHKDHYLLLPDSPRPASVTSEPPRCHNTATTTTTTPLQLHTTMKGRASRQTGGARSANPPIWLRAQQETWPNGVTKALLQAWGPLHFEGGAEGGQTLGGGIPRRVGPARVD